MDRKKLIDWLRGQPEEVRATLRQVLDAFYQAEKSGQPVTTLFLTPDVVAATQSLHAHFDGIDVDVHPEGAERQILLLGESEPDVTILKIEGTEVLQHRALLGSILGTGVSRDRIGDIRIQEFRAEVMVKSSIAGFVCDQLSQVGRDSVQVTDLHTIGFTLSEQEPSEFTVNVSSPRLDAFASQFMHVARDKAQTKIKKGDVKLNHRPCLDVKKTVDVGDTISIRGTGRFQVEELLGRTKKGNERYRCFHFV